MTFNEQIDAWEKLCSHCIGGRYKDAFYMAFQPVNMIPILQAMKEMRKTLAYIHRDECDNEKFCAEEALARVDELLGVK